MKASKNSIHAKIYNYIYSYNLPDNLCPYFWKVLLGCILIIPVFLIKMPVYIVFGISKLFKITESNFEDFKINTDIYDRQTEILAGFIMYLMVTLFVILVISEYNWFKWLFNSFSYNAGMATSGGMINLVIICSLIGRAIAPFVQNRNYKAKEKNTSIVKEFLKAKYNKYCPKIDWE